MECSFGSKAHLSVLCIFIQILLESAQCEILCRPHLFNNNNIIVASLGPITSSTQALLLLPLFTLHTLRTLTCKLIKKGEGEPSWVQG